MAVDALRTYSFLNFSAIAAPLSRMPLSILWSVRWQGSGYILVVAVSSKIVGVVRGFSLGCLLINIGERFWFIFSR
ncbi:hypothetical protein [Photobacterium sanguinicancri]|uniref:hypothetical protein n=1 Tax=Photobacterium sanguinicancri TaxID=875932 RepID=UPI00114021B1|nr:hypothetical protein [Photobacterium sanguinicancri]